MCNCLQLWVPADREHANLPDAARWDKPSLPSLPSLPERAQGCLGRYALPLNLCTRKMKDRMQCKAVLLISL